MERKIGETFEFKGKTYKVVKFNGCANCAFKYNNCPNLTHTIGNCIDFQRSDGAKVMFEEIKGNKLTIDIPEGMEIDLQNSNFDTEVICFKKKQPEFKDGDIAFVESHMLGINTSLMIPIFRKEKEIDKYKFSPALCESNVHDTYLREYPVVLSPSDIKTFRPATNSEKQQLFGALAKEGKAWDAEKKQIVDLKPKWTPKPFDRVITRVSDDAIWTANIFSHINRHGEYVTIGCISGYHHCIPYNEETAKLIGTTKDVEE